MMIPVRCWSCGRVVAKAYDAVMERTEAGEDPQEVMNDLGVERYCCRRMIVAHANVIDDAVPYV